MSSPRSDVLIVGGSVAATRAAEAVTRHAPQLSVTVVSAEPHAPYERPPLSKTPLDVPLDLQKLTYPTVEKLSRAGVRFEYDTRAEAIDVAARSIRTAWGEFGYGALVVATGCEPVVPPLFAGRDGVHVLRDYHDALELREASSDPQKAIAVLGAGFIGGEFAATLVKQGRQVTLIDLATRPLGRFGDAVAHAYEELHRAAGVQLRLGHAAVDIVHSDGRRELLLDDGSLVPADVILLGVGVRPSTDWLTDSELILENGIVCDSTLQAAPAVFAAGDAVRWPNARFDATMRVEHWTNAAEQGRIAGVNAANTVLGAPTLACATVPYFWSDQHGTRIQFAGYRTGHEEIIESRQDNGSVYLYRLGDEVTGVLAFERRQEFVKLRAGLRTSLSYRAAEEALTPGRRVG